MSWGWSHIADWPGHKWLGLIIRFYLGFVFVGASWHKILDPASFALDVATYQLLPLWSVNGFALVLPWVELFAGLMLIVGFRIRAASLLVSMMMLCFIVALLWALYLGLDIACGCFASEGANTHDPISWQTLIRDGFWLALGLHLLLFNPRTWGIDALMMARGDDS